MDSNRLLAADCIRLSGHSVGAVILDSSAAIGNFRSIRLTFSINIWNLLACYTAPIFFTNVSGVETRYLRTLVNSRLSPRMDLQTCRLYVFSRKVGLVPRMVLNTARSKTTLDIDSLLERCLSSSKAAQDTVSQRYGLEIGSGKNTTNISVFVAKHQPISGVRTLCPYTIQTSDELNSYVRGWRTDCGPRRGRNWS